MAWTARNAGAADGYWPMAIILALMVIDLSVPIILKCLMPLIKVLPEELRNKIAAGEVIERPASVVKELIENSIDASSKEIKIEILKGGRGLIRVTDNGIGMDREDALVCIERHATSKLSREDDLFNIRTMGFRGEALPSIASVSKMRIITGVKGSDAGTMIYIYGGEVKEVRDYPAIGTIVEVRDIFFNTPARRKFMRSESTEMLHIIEYVTIEALAHWEIGFKLVADHKEVIQISPAKGPVERIAQIYGQDFLDGLSEFSSDEKGLKMTAFVSRDGNFRNRKTHQFIFVNRRPVKDPLITHAIYQAYEGIPKDSHPIFFLYLTIDPQDVDVNVHPTKREVRFSDRDRVYRFVRDNVRESLRRTKKELGRMMDEDFENTKQGQGYRRETLTSDFCSPSSGDERRIPSYVSENREFSYRSSIPFIYLGETFIALSGRDGLVLMDHHAAHERVLYERFLKGKDIDSYRLLFPKQVKLSPLEYNAILNCSSILNDMGIEIDDFGHDTVIVRSLPAALKEADMKALLSDIASAILEGERPGKPLKQELATKMACHNSIRGREILSDQEVQALINDLEQTENPDHCPHGRPTRIFLTINDLRRMFKRPLR